MILRPLSLKDAPNFCRWLKDPEVTNFLSVFDRRPPTLKEERDWIKTGNVGDGKSIRLSIDTRTGQHIGSISLFKISESHRHAKFGIFIGEKKYWGQGFGTEAGRLILGYGFKVLKLHRIELEVIAYNIRGIKSYQKNGFKIEGRARDYYYRNGYWHDQVRMGLLNDEFKKNINVKKYGK